MVLNEKYYHAGPDGEGPVLDAETYEKVLAEKKYREGHPKGRGLIGYTRLVKEEEET